MANPPDLSCIVQFIHMYKLTPNPQTYPIKKWLIFFTLQLKDRHQVVKDTQTKASHLELAGTEGQVSVRKFPGKANTPQLGRLSTPIL